MTNIKKQIITDENGHPVAVQIAYADWVALESQLAEDTTPIVKTSELGKHFGVMPLRIDPTAFQEQVRDEWP